MENNDFIDARDFTYIGVKPSLPDDRDFLYQNIDQTIPTYYSMIPYLNPVRNQGQQGSCFAQSVACMKEFQETIDYGRICYFSPQFFYDHRANIRDNDPNNDYGMYGRDVMKLLTTIGICDESLCPYGNSFIYLNQEDKEKCYNNAKLHTIKTYSRVYDINSLKSVLYHHGPAIICFPIYHFGLQMWKRSDTNNKLHGGHAMTVVGYDETGFQIRNSWGSHWGDNGYDHYYYDDWGAHWEIWATVDSKTIHQPDPNLEKIDEEKDNDSENSDVNKPKPDLDDPEPALDEPERDLDEPEPDSEEPEPDLDEPERDLDEPEPDSDKPEPDLDEPKPDLDEPKPDLDEPESEPKSKNNIIKKIKKMIYKFFNW